MFRDPLPVRNPGVGKSPFYKIVLSNPVKTVWTGCGETSSQKGDYVTINSSTGPQGILHMVATVAGLQAVQEQLAKTGLSDT